MQHARARWRGAIPRSLSALCLAVVACAPEPGGLRQLRAPSTGPRPPPAKLTVLAATGASVHIDGTFVGTAPLANPIDVDPGERFVAVTGNGFHPQSGSVWLEPGEATDVSVDLELTDQRTASWALIGVGAAGLSAGIVFGVLSVVEHREARDILQRQDEEYLGVEDRRAYDEALAARDDYRVGSGIAASVGLAALLVGGALYVLDSPVVPSLPTARDERSGAPTTEQPTQRAPVLDVSALPIVEPRFTGGMISFQF